MAESNLLQAMDEAFWAREALIERLPGCGPLDGMLREARLYEALELRNEQFKAAELAAVAAGVWRLPAGAEYLAAEISWLENVRRAEDEH